MCMLIPDARSESRNGNAQLLLLLLLRVLSTILLNKTTMLRHFHLCFSVTVTVTILRTSFFLSHVYRVTRTHLKGSSDQRRLKIFLSMMDRPLN